MGRLARDARSSGVGLKGRISVCLRWHERRGAVTAGGLEGLDHPAHGRFPYLARRLGATRFVAPRQTIRWLLRLRKRVMYSSGSTHQGTDLSSEPINSEVAAIAAAARSIAQARGTMTNNVVHVVQRNEVFWCNVCNGGQHGSGSDHCFGGCTICRFCCMYI